MKRQKIYTIKIDGKDYISLTPLTEEELRKKISDIKEIGAFNLNRPCSGCQEGK